MNFTGKKVKHRSYGTGVIVAYDEKYIDILFENEEKSRKFPYPGVFKTFVCLLDKDATDEIKKVIDQYDAKICQDQRQNELVRSTFVKPIGITTSRYSSKTQRLRLIHMILFMAFVEHIKERLKMKFSI